MSSYDGSIRIDARIDTKNFDKGINTMNSSLKKLGALIMSVFSITAIAKFANECVSKAGEMQSALVGLQSIIEGQGRSFEQATQFIQSYIDDGLVPMNNAVTAYKNLAARGYSDEQIQRVLIALKDAASFGRQASLTLGYAVESATEGLKN